MILQNKIGRCGVYCGQCRAYTGELVKNADQLKKWVETDYSWIKDTEQSFDYENFLNGLDWFINSKCPGCRDSSMVWCEVKKCEKIQKNLIDNCLVCEEFPKCPHTEYQRKRYTYLFKHIEYIKKNGLEKHLKEEEKKAEDGVRIQDIREY